MIPILLLGLALRLAPWGQNRFLEDEALYAYWGLQIASGADPMLDLEPVDKPPLYPYTLGLSAWLHRSHRDGRPPAQPAGQPDRNRSALRPGARDLWRRAGWPAGGAAAGPVAL